jgi:hypothetical protein
MRLLSMTLLCTGLLCSTATAQTEQHWLVLTAASEGDPVVSSRAESRVRDALSRQGADLWSPEAAATRFESEASAPPTVLSARELEHWRSLSRAGVDELAEGNNQRALKKLNAALDISRDAIEELNRDPERARVVFDTCLYVVRAVQATESEARARSVARECRQLVPRAEPSPYMHPPTVTNLLDSIDALQAKQSGELVVESEPPGCPARLNGVLLGETPVSIGELFPGEYRVQVECDPGERGRVHATTVGAGRTVRRVDTRFDEAIRSRPALTLRYPSAAEADQHCDGDVRTIAREVGVDGAVVVSMSAPDTMELRLVDVKPPQNARPAALALIPVDARGASGTKLEAAAHTLTVAECTDFTTPEPTTLPCANDLITVAGPAETDRPVQRRPRGQFIAGVTLASVGLASLATGYVLLIPLDKAGSEWLSAFEDSVSPAVDFEAQQRWLDIQGGILFTSIAGSAMLVTAMPLALPEKSKTPWWAWVAGVGGLGLTATSIALGVTAESEPGQPCSSNRLIYDQAATCVLRARRVSGAWLTGLTSAPLLTMPLVYLFRPKKPGLEATVRAGRGHAYLGVRGTF